MILHLATNKEAGFNYMAYLAVMSALLHNQVILWMDEEPEGKWFELIKKMEIKSPHLDFAKIHPLTGITIDQHDQTGRLDIIYLAPFTKESIDDAFIDHNLLGQGKDGLFERKDITLVRVFVPEDQPNLDFITPEWVSANDTLLSALIKRAYLERVWNPYGRQKV